MTSIDEIKRKTVTGAIALGVRTGLLQIISFGGTFLLTLFLTPDVFGIFYVVSALIAFLTYFSDIGLAAALIQKKEAIDRRDLVTTFTLQQVIVISLCITAYVALPWIQPFYKLSQEGVYLFIALIVAFFLSSLKTIPSVILERRLEFNRLILPQILETLIFNIASVGFAVVGMGIRSFTYAVMLRGIVGLIAMYAVQPWKPALGFSKESSKKLLSFGVPFQFNSFLALLKDDLFTLFLGKVLPFQQVGYIGWAKKWAEAPLRLIMDSVVKVTFPAYSRLQDHPEKLSRAVERSIFFILIFLAPLSVGMMFFIQPFVDLVPRYVKWEPALFSFMLFVVASLIAGISTPLINALNAIGNITTSLKFMVFWTVFTWFVAPFALFKFGFNGFALTALLMSLSVGAVIMVTKRYISLRIGTVVAPALVSSGVLALVLGAYRFVIPVSWGSLFFGIVLGAFVYLGILYLGFRTVLFEHIASVRTILKK